MKASTLAMRQYKVILVFATIWGSVPWLLSCVYIPIALATPHGNAQPPWGLFNLILLIFGPLYSVSEYFFPYHITIISDHTRWLYHYRNWTLFSILNIGFWFLVLSMLRLLFIWIRFRMGPGRE